MLTVVTVLLASMFRLLQLMRLQLEQRLLALQSKQLCQEIDCVVAGRRRRKGELCNLTIDAEEEREGWRGCLEDGKKL